MVDAREARQWEAPVVFVTGLAEGEFPRSPREDPFLTDGDRQRLNRRGSISLRELQNERDEERFLFYVAATRPRDLLFLTWPLTDGSGEERARSSFLTALLDGKSLKRCALFAREIVEQKLTTVGPLPHGIDRQEIYGRLNAVFEENRS